MCMKFFLNCLCFFFLIPLGLTFAADRQSEYLDFPPINKTEHIRIRGDRFIHGDFARLLLEIPTQVALQEAKEQPTELNGSVAAFDGESPPIAETPFTLQINKNGRVISGSSLELILDVSKAGPAPLEIRVRFDAFQEDPLLQVPVWNVRKVKNDLQMVNPVARDEITSWVDEANHTHLIWGKQPLWPNLDRALLQPDTPYAGLKGFLIRSYVSPHLRQRQPYTVYVPENLNLGKPAPLMILLHGSGGDYRNLIADFAAGQEFENHPMLIANAGAYKNTEFRHMPLHDVKWIIEDMQRKYNVDASRIYAQGISLGGRGVLDLSARMPDTFAAISSQGTYGVHHELLDPFYSVETDPVAYRFAAKNDIRTWLPNLSSTPVEMVYGWQDTSTRPVGALAIAIRLQRLGIPVVERGFNQGHNLTLPDYDWSTTREWFLQHRKNLAPRRLLFRVDNLRHNRHAWLRVDALHDYADIGDVSARFGVDGNLIFKTRNVAQITYLPPDAPNFSTESRIYRFDKAGNEIEADPLPKGGKHPGQSGPLWNLFSEPLIIVVDETENPALQQRLRSAAKQNAVTDRTPSGWQFPVKMISEVSEEELRQSNLLWITYPGSPHPWRKQIPCPLPPAGEAIRAQAPESQCLVALRPSPWSDNHLVTVMEIGQTAAAPGLYRSGIFQEPLQPDWIIFDKGRIRAAGIYQHDWNPGAMTTENYVTRVITQ